MTEQTTPEVTRDFPANWHIAADYDPNNHLMQLKGRDYLNVQNRLLWFLRDQRNFISSGLARTSYIIETRLVEQDREVGYAHFSTYIRDVLGNEATMYGSETAKDFGDYAEKASTKSMGRALLALGYGTAFAPEMDEGERVVDAPVERKRQSGIPAEVRQPATARPAQQPAQAPRKVEIVRNEPDPPFGTMIQTSPPSGAQDAPKRSLRERMRDLGFRTDAQYYPWAAEVTGKSEQEMRAHGVTEDDMKALRAACERLEEKATQASTAVRPAQSAQPA